LSVSTAFSSIHAAMRAAVDGSNGSQINNGFPNLPAHLSVHFVPGSSRDPAAGCRINVASESRTFHSVLNDRGVSGA
jgi:hypothetical protein